MIRSVKVKARVKSDYPLLAMVVRLIILLAVCTAVVNTGKIVISDTTPSPSELYRRYLAQVGGEGKQSPEVMKPVARSTFDDALKAGMHTNISSIVPVIYAL